VNGDAYAKGWTAGYTEAMRDMRKWVAAINGASVVLSTGEYIDREDIIIATYDLEHDAKQRPQLPDQR
jgi:hypothetical protein